VSPANAHQPLIRPAALDHGNDLRSRLQRVEGHQLHIDQLRTGLERQEESVARQVGRVVRPFVDACAAARGQNDGLRRDGQEPAIFQFHGDSARGAVFFDQDPGGQDVVQDLHPQLLRRFQQGDGQVEAQRPPQPGDDVVDAGKVLLRSLRIVLQVVVAPVRDRERNSVLPETGDNDGHFPHEHLEQLLVVEVAPNLDHLPEQVLLAIRGRTGDIGDRVRRAAALARLPLAQDQDLCAFLPSFDGRQQSRPASADHQDIRFD
jgi:hypothetical protein